MKTFNNNGRSSSSDGRATDYFSLLANKVPVKRQSCGSQVRALPTPQTNKNVYI